MKLPKCLWNTSRRTRVVLAFITTNGQRTERSVKCSSKEQEGFQIWIVVPTPPNHNSFKPVRGNHNVVDGTHSESSEFQRLTLSGPSRRKTPATVVMVQSVPSTSDVFQNPHPYQTSIHFYCLSCGISSSSPSSDRSTMFNSDRANLVQIDLDNSVTADLNSLLY